MTAKIYVAYHRWAPRIQGGPFTPIHVGRAASSAPLANMIGDDTGDNISDRNAAWCELTAIYWAWKNDTTSERIGLMHYRRVLDIFDEEPGGEVETHVKRFNVTEWSEKASEWLDGPGKDYDILLPRMHRMGRTVEENYKKGHAGQDFDLARDVISADYPDYLDAFDHTAGRKFIRLGNIAVMKRALFHEYCELLFGVLQKIEDTPLDRRYYSVYQDRYLGFLAERLLTLFVHHAQKNNPDLKIKEFGILNLADAYVTPYLAKDDAPSEDTVNIALAADRTYLPHTAAMLRTLMDKADPARPINLFFMYSGLSGKDLDGLRRMLSTRPGTELHPINIGELFDKSYRSASRAPSNMTYSRFLLFSLLPGLDRILYLDTDMIINADVCDLYDTDIDGKPLAAVTDWIMTRTLFGPTPTIDPDVPDLAVYHRERLEMNDDEIARYFNAGVLMFNFAAMDDPIALGDRLMKEIDTGRYLFRDQDILNKEFKSNFFQLDARWNVFNSDDHVYMRVPRPLWNVAMAARKDPWIIHYADRSYKPWGSGVVPLSEHYWQALIRTPYFAEVSRKRDGKASDQRRKPPKKPAPEPAKAPNNEPRPPDGQMVALAKRIARRMPFLKGPMIRVYYLFKGSR